MIKVIRGNPTDEELAALVAVLVAASGSAPEPARPERRWSSPARRLRSPAYGRSPGGWRASGLPR